MKKFITILALSGFLYSMPQGARYLIICPDEFYDEVLPLAEWKTEKGMLAKVAKLSETGSTSSQIKNYIEEAYTSWEVPPEYVLLVGSTNIIPMPSSQNDHYYALLDGDIYDDVYVGRLPASSEFEVQTMVSKILHYEKEPYIGDTTWFSKATLIVREDYEQYSDSIYWQNTYYAAQLLVEAGYTHIDTFSMAQGNNSQDVINAINAGRTFVMYRGQGVGYWWSPFHITASSLNNGFKQPLVISTTCATLGSSNDMGEDWMRTGSPSNPKGCIGFIGTTTVHSGYAAIRSAMAKGIVRAIYGDGTYILGKAFDKARRYLLQEVGMVDDYYGFTLYGDPELNLMTALPREPEVDFPNPIPPGTDELTVTVTLDGSPVAGALVCLKADTLIYKWAYTNSYGQATFFTEFPDTGRVLITVSGHNIYPRTDTATIVSSGPYVHVISYSTDEIQGNGDGLLNPGETFSLNVVFKNSGMDTSFGTTAKLISNDSSVTILDSLVDIGTLIPDDTTGIEDAFRIKIKNNAKDGQSLALTVKIYDSEGDTWQSNLSSLLVYAPNLNVFEYFFVDTINGNGNGIIEPGEYIEITPSVANVGHQNIEGAVLKVLSTSDNFAITDAIVELGPIGIGDTVTDYSDVLWGFVPSYVTDGEIEIVYEISGNTTTATHADTGLIIMSIVSSSVPVGPDSYGYYAYDDTDVASGQAPVFDWFEIAPPGPGTIISEITNEDADTVTIPLPFTFKFYGIEYDSIGICSNGFLELGRATYKFGYNTGIPEQGGPKRLIAPMWCDLDPSEGGDIYKYYDSSNHRWIVEFKDVVRYGGSNPSTFQVILYDPQYYPTPTGDGVIVFLYESVGQANDCTVGIEDHTETVGIQYLYNGNYDPNAAPLISGRAIKFTTTPPEGITPQLIMDPFYVVFDTLSGDGDGAPEWGETFVLNIRIINSGDNALNNITAVLHSIDDVSTALDSVSYYGTIAPGDTSTNENDPFVVSLPSASQDSSADFKLTLRNNSGILQEFYFGISVGLNVGIKELSKGLPGTFLYVPRPNPARENAVITFSLTKKEPVRLAVYDVAGRRVKVLLRDELAPGIHSIYFDGRDSSGRKLGSGVYFIELRTKRAKLTRKLLLIR